MRYHGSIWINPARRWTLAPFSATRQLGGRWAPVTGERSLAGYSVPEAFNSAELAKTIAGDGVLLNVRLKCAAVAKIAPGIVHIK